MKLTFPVAEMDKSLRQEGPHTVSCRLPPNTQVTPILDVNVLHAGDSSGIDVKIQNTTVEVEKVWINACTNEIQNCKPVHDKDESIDDRKKIKSECGSLYFVCLIKCVDDTS